MKHLLYIILATPIILSANQSKDLSNDKENSENKDGTVEKFSPVQYPFGIGFAGIFSPNPYKDTDPTILPVPVISYKGEDLTLNGPYASYRFFHTNNTASKVQLFLYPEVFKADKSNDPQLRLLDNRNYLFMLGLSQSFKSTHGDINFSANIDVTTKTNGYLLSAEYSKKFFLPASSKFLFFITPSLGVTYSSQQITNYFYGISTSEAIRSGLPEYNTSGALSPYLGANMLINFSKRWNLFVATRLNRLPDQIYDSPMVSQRYIFTTVLSLTYNFSFT
ncbi:MAG: MipA/OmpV family protein [Proteobacteria bacterium]|nr:MipA/OmpV family protein [Pseudomonadota bacterium]